MINYNKLTDDSRLEINHYSTRYHLAGARLVEEGIEAII